MPFEFEKLTVYQRAVSLAGHIYDLCKSLPKQEQYGITSQLCRAGLSIAQNIAEGSGRHSRKDFVRFLHIARSSAYECIPLLEVAHRQGFVSDEQQNSLYSELDEIARMLNGLVNSLQKGSD